MALLKGHRARRPRPVTRNACHDTRRLILRSRSHNAGSESDARGSIAAAVLARGAATLPIIAVCRNCCDRDKGRDTWRQRNASQDLRQDRLRRRDTSDGGIAGANPDDESGPAGFGQSELAALGHTRADAARRLDLPREDHALRSRADSRADRPRARLRRARLLSAVQVAREADAGRVPAGSEEEDAGVRALFHRRRRRGLRRHAARRARLCREVLHRGRQLRPRRQQHPGVLHPGRDQVSRSDPLGEDGARSRLPAGGVGPRHVLGFRDADAREHAHADVGDVRSHHSALVPHDGRLRRAHLPARRRERAIDLRQVPLAAEDRRRRRSSGTSP